MHDKTTRRSSFVLSSRASPGLPEISTPEIDEEHDERRRPKSVSFEETVKDTDPESLAPRGRWGVGRRWSRSPSPRVRVTSASPNGRIENDLESKMGGLQVEEKKRRSLFKKSFNPDDPETDDERRTREKISHVMAFIRKQRIGMMTSRNAKGYLVASAFAVAQVENGIDFVFHANSRTCNVDDIDNDAHMNLSFQNSETAEWVSIAGTAKLITDEEQVAEYIRRVFKDWESDGKTSSGIIRFKTQSIAYCIGDDFEFKPMSEHNGIISGEVLYASGTVKIDEAGIKMFRKRAKHHAKRR